jgi:4-hydroxy-tetrahydrodipicolinate synthase
MVLSLQIGGFVPPLVTPLTSGGDIDVPALAQLADRLVRAGVHAIFALGTSAEFSLLTSDQHKCVVDTTLEAVAGRIPVLVGVSDTVPARVKKRLAWAQTAGAAAGVVCPPYYFPFSQAEIRSFILEVLGAADLPIMLYNIPSLAQNQLEVELVTELAGCARIIGIKDSSGDFIYFQHLLRGTRSVRAGFSVMQGRECLSAASLLMGADGLVPGLGNLVPELCVSLLEAAQAATSNAAEHCRRN